MGLEVVKEEIIRQAKEQEAALIAEAREESNKILKEAEQKIQEMKEKSDAMTKRAIETIKMQELASAELENKKMLLEGKKQVIEAVFLEAKNELQKLDDKETGSYIEKLLEKTKKEIDIEYVYCSKKSAKFLKEFNAEPIDIIGGLIAENKDKTIRVDYSFETIIHGIKESEMQNISKILFG